MATIAPIQYSNTNWGNESENMNQNFNNLNTELVGKVDKVTGSGLITDTLNTALTNRSWIAVGTVASAPTSSTSTYTFNGTSYTAYAGTIVRLTKNNFLYICTAVSGSTRTWVAVQTDLSDYATTAWVNQQLANYSTTTQMNNAITTATADMATRTWVNTQLANYTTTSDLNTLLSGYWQTTTGQDWVTNQILTKTPSYGSRFISSVTASAAVPTATTVLSNINLGPSNMYDQRFLVSGLNTYVGIGISGVDAPSSDGREFSIFIPNMGNSNKSIYLFPSAATSLAVDVLFNGSLINSSTPAIIPLKASSGLGSVVYGWVELNIRIATLSTAGTIVVINQVE